MPPALSRLARLLALLVLATGAARPALAQTFQAADPARTPGWVFTPTFVFSMAHDDNVTLAGRRAPSESDTLTVFTGSADLEYRGRHHWVGGGYNGSFSLYRQLDELNTFDQLARIDSRHELSRRVSLQFHDSLSLHPTTDVVGLLGVPFVRTGSRMNDARAQLRVQAAPHTSVNASYTHQWVGFNKDTPFAQFLRGGVAHVFAGSVEQQVSRRLSIGAQYTFRRAVFADEVGQFDTQDGGGTVSYQATPTLTLSGALGFARLSNPEKEPSVPAEPTSKTGPSWRIALDQRFERATVNASYLRSYVPSFGLGGTQQNEEFTAGLHMPLARNRLYWQASFSWRRNEPVSGIEQNLESLWLQTRVGYSLQRWLRIEGYYWRSQQDSQFAGGRVYRNSLGVQVVTAMPMRIQ